MNAAWTTFKVGGERPMRARGAQPLGANAEWKNGSPDWTPPLESSQSGLTVLFGLANARLVRVQSGSCGEGHN